MFQENQERPAWTKLTREAWIFSGVYGFSRAIQVWGMTVWRVGQYSV